MADKKCLYCDEVIKGRNDKKFCDDQCRNAYHNSQNRTPNNYVRQVNAILRKNRRILEQLNTTGKTNIPREKLIHEGFSFDFYTSIFRNKEGKTYYFCYEQGYLPLENEWLMLVIKKDFRDQLKKLSDNE